MATESYFTKILEAKLEEEGIEIPPAVLAILDIPFNDFTEKDRKFYKTQFQGRRFPDVFSKLLQGIYETSSKSGKHSWKAMCRLLKDSPMKHCALSAIEKEEEDLPGAAPGGLRHAKMAGIEEAGLQERRTGIPKKSFFTRKLENILKEREIEIPSAIINLLDTPFEDFTEEDRELYEDQFKGRQLTFLFSEILQDLYEQTGKSRYGWEASCRYLKDSPIKLCAVYVIEEEERLQKAPQEELTPSRTPGSRPASEKHGVKSYQPPPISKESRRRRK